MPSPAKKAVPTLKDMMDKKDDVELVDPSKDHVHTWEEDHDHNLARVQKDVVVSGKPAENAQVMSTSYETSYAEPADRDDTGRAPINYMDEDE